MAVIVNIDFHPDLVGDQKGERSYSGALTCDSVSVQGGALVLENVEGYARKGFSLAYIESWTEEPEGIDG